MAIKQFLWNSRLCDSPVLYVFLCQYHQLWRKVWMMRVSFISFRLELYYLNQDGILAITSSRETETMSHMCWYLISENNQYYRVRVPAESPSVSHVCNFRSEPELPWRQQKVEGSCSPEERWLSPREKPHWFMWQGHGKICPRPLQPDHITRTQMPHVEL